MREFNDYKEMSQKEFREMQMIELNIMLYFDDFCKKHNLRYYMSGGTLIGAVRHKGFIPWDEDIDLHMPRPDYEKLPELWEKYAQKDKYNLCITDLEHNTRQHAYMICDSDTTLIEERTINDDVPQGIRIDIMPYDGRPDSEMKARIQFFWAAVFSIYNVQRLPENQGGKLMRFGVKCALGIIKNPRMRYKIWNYAKSQMSKYDFETSPWVREMVCPMRSARFKYPRDRFDEPIYLEFEGHMLPAHHYYKDYLENVYTGYMELPPEDKRTPKTNAVYINLDRGYANYKGIKYCKEGK